MCKTIKANYTNILNKRFLENKDKLIESFIEYYGEKHRDRIRSIYDNTIIVYHVGQNKISTIEITKIFYKKVETYIEENIKRDIQEESNYRKNFYLVEKLYTYFKNVIKEARISRNRIYFFKHVKKRII